MGGLMAFAWCQTQWAMNSNDAHALNKAKVRLTLKVVKYLSDTTLEYICLAVVIAGGVIFDDTIGTVIGFGSFTLQHAARILAAQMIPEMLVDTASVGIISSRLGL